MTDSDLKTLLDNLEACKTSLHSRLHCWTWLVVIGVALEFVSLLWEFIRERRDFQRAEIHAPEKPNFVLYVFGFLGIALVVAGISGELHIDVQLGTVETSIRKANDDRFALLKQRADDVANEADVITDRLGKASKQLDAIEDTIRVQGPRGKLLEANRNEFIRVMRPFRGQHVKVMKCGVFSTAEVSRLEQDLIDMLGEKGARWMPEVVIWPRCVNGATDIGGNLIIVSDRAGNSVKDAAKALWEELNTIEISTIKAQSNTDELGFPLSGDNNPWGVAGKDPSAVVLLVGANPMFDLSEWKKRHKGAHK